MFRTNVGEIVLKTVATAGLISLAVLAPNAVQMLKMFEKGKKRKKSPKYVINESIQRLLKNGMIVKNENGFVELTDGGEKCLDYLLMKEKAANLNKKWDNKWRVVIYDVKEYKRTVRNKLKFTLEDFGFVKLQNSVWVYPYDCEDLITLLKADFKIGKEILYIVADKIENDYWMRKIFELP